jgi:hypothetical protein
MRGLGAASWNLGYRACKYGLMLKAALEFLFAATALVARRRAMKEAIDIPARLRTINTYAPVPASVIATKGQTLKGLWPGLVLGPLPVAYALRLGHRSFDDWI